MLKGSYILALAVGTGAVVDVQLLLGTPLVSEWLVLVLVLAPALVLALVLVHALPQKVE